MINDIRVYSRIYIEDLITTRETWGLKYPWILVSIYSDTTGPVVKNDKDFEILARKGCIDWEAYDFHDLDQEKYNKIIAQYPSAKKEYKLFSRRLANKLLKFINNFKNDEREIMLVIHCQAGISRSGAVGIFACRYLGLDERRFLTMHPNILPNALVYDTLYKASGLTGDFSRFWESADN
jgi:hypothetical protein